MAPEVEPAVDGGGAGALALAEEDMMLRFEVEVISRGCMFKFRLATSGYAIQIMIILLSAAGSIPTSERVNADNNGVGCMFKFTVRRKCLSD